MLKLGRRLQAGRHLIAFDGLEATLREIALRGLRQQVQVGNPCLFRAGFQ